MLVVVLVELVEVRKDVVVVEVVTLVIGVVSSLNVAMIPAQ